MTQFHRFAAIAIMTPSLCAQCAELLIKDEECLSMAWIWIDGVPDRGDVAMAIVDFYTEHAEEELDIDSADDLPGTTYTCDCCKRTLCADDVARYDWS